MFSQHADHPLHTLLTAFLSWKALLLAIAVASSATGPSYDTSTTLALHRDEADTAGSLVTRLTRWDAIYFIASAHRGYLYEQEWAFGPGFPAVVRALAVPIRALRSLLTDAADAGIDTSSNVTPSAGGAEASLEAGLGIFVSHVAHFGAVWALYELTRTLFVAPVKDGAKGTDTDADAGAAATTPLRRLPFFAALLHIISPAGLFLSAPYAESGFAFLSFVGYLLLARAAGPHHDGSSGSTLRRAVLQVAAGALFGFATAFRTNGMLNGIPFAAECLFVVADAPVLRGGGLGSLFETAASLVGPVVGGLLVAAGSVVPQAVAYLRYCSDVSQPREWCGWTVPSIYSFVQDRYWGNGFLRYWTLSNLPLFLLGAPVLTIMLVSGVSVARRPSTPGLPGDATAGKPLNPRAGVLVVSMAVLQVVLAVMALFNHHVQVITRLASGYPVWYWWVAGCLAPGDSGGSKRFAWGSRIVGFMVMYAMIQGALFSCFLPPA